MTKLIRVVPVIPEVIITRAIGGDTNSRAAPLQKSDSDIGEIYESSGFNGDQH